MKRHLALIVALFLSIPVPSMAIDTGDYARVKWKDKWYDAEVLETSGTRLRVHYRGYENSWDEWITMDRVAIQVLWKGKWYSATAIRSEEGKVLIHYDGYDKSWDEWITLDRIRSY